MQITFDNSLKQRVFQHIRKALADAADPHSPFCERPITGKNFAGAAMIQGELRAFCRCIICLMGVAKEFKDE